MLTLFLKGKYGNLAVCLGRTSLIKYQRYPKNRNERFRLGVAINIFYSVLKSRKWSLFLVSTDKVNNFKGLHKSDGNREDHDMVNKV